MTEKLSEHFTLDEMLFSETAIARKIDNTPTSIHKKILIHTCQYLLEKIRMLLNEKYKEYKGKKVKCVTLRVTSGYRSAKLNAAVGGQANSKHCKGEAADLEATIVYTNGKKVILPYNELYESIKAWVKSARMSVDQCIQEAAKDKKTGAWYYWVHVSHNNAGATRDRRQFLKFNNGTYTLDR
jgi:hypothetical protein